MTTPPALDGDVCPFCGKKEEPHFVMSCLQSLVVTINNLRDAATEYVDFWDGVESPPGRNDERLRVEHRLYGLLGEP